MTTKPYSNVILLMISNLLEYNHFYWKNINNQRNRLSLHSMQKQQNQIYIDY
jgi:hypothetical protein